MTQRKPTNTLDFTQKVQLLELLRSRLKSFNEAKMTYGAVAAKCTEVLGFEVTRGNVIGLNEKMGLGITGDENARQGAVLLAEFRRLDKKVQHLNDLVIELYDYWQLSKRPFQLKNGQAEKADA